MGEKMAARMKFSKPFAPQEPIPAPAIERAVEIMQSSRQNHYNLAERNSNGARGLEREYAEWQGVNYCITCTSSIIEEEVRQRLP